MFPLSTRADMSRPSEEEVGFLILQHLLPGVGMSNLTWAFECVDGMRADVFDECLRWTVRRHPALRTVFPAEAGGWARRTLAPDEVRIALEDIEVAPAQRDDTIRHLMTRPFDITSQLPIHAALVHTTGGAARPTLVLAIHHVALDAAAATILLGELDWAYRARVTGAELPPEEVVAPPRPAPATAPEASMRYWRDHLAGVDARSMVLRGRQRDLEPRTFAARSVYVPAGEAACNGVRALRMSLGATPNMVLLTAFYALLATSGAGGDLTVGSLVRWFDDDDSDGARIGHHTTMLALRVRTWGEQSFRELAGSVGECLFRGLEHAGASIDQVLPSLDLPSGGWRTPVFRQVFNFLPDGMESASTDRPLSFGTWIPMGKTLIRYELEFNINETSTGLGFTVVYSTELFDDDTVAELIQRYQQILAAAGDHPDIRLSALAS